MSKAPQYLKMGTDRGTFYLYGFTDKQDRALRRIKATHNSIEFHGTVDEMKDKVRLAKKLIPSRTLVNQHDPTKRLEVWFHYGTGMYYPHTPLNALATAVKEMEKMIGKKLSYFIITREEL